MFPTSPGIHVHAQAVQAGMEGSGMEGSGMEVWSGRSTVVFTEWRICALLGRKGPSVNACEHSQYRAKIKSGHAVPSVQLWLHQI